MAMVTHDDRSYLLDGRRIWLISGSVHYFRIPQALWRDRLVKAARGGLNCISTYVAWNYHEPTEGQWELSGERDIVGFVRLAAELGLYVILRPGPYIGAEWDFGGLPGWLCSKTGMAYRTSNAAYTHYYDKYFRQVLTRLAELQVTRGGNIVLIQNENEYVMTTMPDRQSYLEFVNQLFRRSGFDIPIISSNLMTDPPVAENIESVVAWSEGIQRLKRLRRRQPKAPMMVSSFRCGAPDTWGREHVTRSAAETARRALEIMGCGAQLDYCMWSGGTNFDFWGARTGQDDSSYSATSYDCDAPVAEGGGLTEKYYLTRLVNMLAKHMGRLIAPCAGQAPGVSIHDNTQVLNLTGPTGGWAVVTNSGREDVAAARVSTPTGVELAVSLAPLGAVAIPVELEITPAVRLDYANLMPLGLFGGGILVFHGPPGWNARISINGKETTAVVPEGEEVWTGVAGGMKLVIVNSELAMRTWVVGESLIFGPQFVGEKLEDITEHPHSKRYVVIPFEGEPSELPAHPVARKAGRITLGTWKRLAVCTEPVAKDLEWRKIDRPRDVDHLGVHHGYVWYRLEIQQKRASRRKLLLPDCEDRATVYLNGSLVGVWGRGPGATRAAMSAAVRRGRNLLTLLVDNLGRFSDEPNLGQLKGLFGHVHDAKLLSAPKFRKKPFDRFTRRMVPRHCTHLIAELESTPIWSLEVPIALSRVYPIHVSFSGLSNHVAVLCNDRQARFFPNSPGRANFGDVTLGSELRKGKNLIKLLLWGEAPSDVMKKVKLHMLLENLSHGASWSFRPWNMPEPGGRVVGKNRPAWYVARFKYSGQDEPLFLRIAGAKKGQIFVNGHNVGRFWSIGPQEHYYLPACWLKDVNELMVFEEQGLIPARSSLALRPQGPYRQPS